MTTGASPGRTGGHPGDRTALLAIGAQFWINGMVYASIVPRLPEFRDRLEIDIATLGLVLTSSAVGGLIGSALTGRVIERFGTKRVIVVGSIGMLSALPIAGLAPSAIALVGVLIGLSLFDVAVDIGMNIQGSRLSGRRSVPVMNRLHALWSVGTVMSGLLAVQAAERGMSVPVHLVLVAASLGLVLLFSARHLLPTDEPPDKRASGRTEDEADTNATDVDVDAADADADADADVGVGVGVAADAGIGLRPVLMFGLLGAAAVTMELTTSDWAPFRLVDDLGVPSGRAGLGFVAFTSGMVTGRLLGDWVEARIGARALTGRGAILAGVGLVAATVFPAEALGIDSDGSGPLIWTLVWFFVAALGVSVIFPRLYDGAAKAPGPPGRGLGALTAGTRAAGLATPVVVGSLAATSLTVGAAVALVTIPCCVLIHRLRT